MSGGAAKGRGVSVSAVLVQLLPAFLVCAMFAAVGIVHVTSRVMVVGVGYQLSKLEAENRDLVRENDRLKIELATLKSPTRLERVGRADLGMLPPPPGAVLSLGGGRDQRPSPRLAEQHQGAVVLEARAPAPAAARVVR